MPALNNPKHELLRAARELVTYDAGTGRLTWRRDRYRVKAGDEAGQYHPAGYRMVTVCQKRLLVHRLIWALHYGDWPEHQLDHINGNRSDNRISNLRLATVAENTRNGRRRSTNRSGFKGVSRNGWLWRATIVLDGKQRFLGNFDDPELAHQAYVAAATELHGDFARVA